IRLGDYLAAYRRHDAGGTWFHSGHTGRISSESGAQWYDVGYDHCQYDPAFAALADRDVSRNEAAGAYPSGAFRRRCRLAGRRARRAHLRTVLSVHAGTLLGYSACAGYFHDNGYRRRARPWLFTVVRSWLMSESDNTPIAKAQATERQLRALFLAGLEGDAQAYQSFLQALGGNLRAFLRKRLSYACSDV